MSAASETGRARRKNGAASAPEQGLAVFARNRKAGSGSGNEILQVLAGCRTYYLYALLFSVGINLLFLAPTLYMMQVYDRVLNTGNMATLLMLSLILLAALVCQGVLEVLRAQLLVRASVRIERVFWTRVMKILLDRCAQAGNAGRSEAIRDLDTFRQFVTGTGFLSVLDVPWLPFYLLIIWMIHPLLLLASVGIALVLIVTALANEHMLRRPLAQAAYWSARNYEGTEAVLRNTEAILAMGMERAMLAHFEGERASILGWQSHASDISAVFAALTKFERMAAQSLMMAVGVWLACNQMISAGGMFAVLLLFGRALSPIEQVVGSWRQFVTAQGAYLRLNALLESAPVAPPPMPLMAPTGAISVERLVLAPPGTGTMDGAILKGLTFAIPAGQMVGVIGPSAAGKSSLARVLTGAWRPTAGTVRIDGADIRHWDRSELGQYVGYLPQDVDLFAGSVRQNIARFTEAPAEMVIDAAVRANVHDMILRLPRGYDTELTPSGGILSGGQRQRLGLARAIFGNPRLVVLDEPNSNLDHDGEQALLAALAGLKAQGVTVIVIAHKPSLLGSVDLLLVMRNGMIEGYGPRQEISAQYTKPKLVEAAAG